MKKQYLILLVSLSLYSLTLCKPVPSHQMGFTPMPEQQMGMATQQVQTTQPAGLTMGAPVQGTVHGELQTHKNELVRQQVIDHNQANELMKQRNIDNNQANEMVRQQGVDEAHRNELVRQRAIDNNQANEIMRQQQEDAKHVAVIQKHEGAIKEMGAKQKRIGAQIRHHDKKHKFTEEIMGKFEKRISDLENNQKKMEIDIAKLSAKAG